MTIVKKTLKNETPQRKLDSHGYFENMCGFWGSVTDVHSETNSVDVMSCFSVEYKDIPVSSRTWVNSGKTDDYKKDWSSASRDLPPKGSTVFVLMPNRTIDTAFVLCSGFLRGEKDTHNLYASSKAEKSDYDKEFEKITCGGWKVKESYEDGTLEVKNNDKTVSLKIDNQKNEVELEAYDSKITIDSKGISISGKMIDINGKDNGGLVVGKKLAAQLIIASARVDAIIAAIQGASVTPLDGGATLLAALKAGVSAISQKENYADIESFKVMHGNGAI